MVATMREIPRRPYTLEEYFALEGVGETRYEYWDGEIVCMSGGSRQHVTASSNIHVLLGRQLWGKNCRAFTGELQIKTPILPPYRYPDVSVVCGKPEFEKIAGFDVLVNPILVVEVLSPGTAHLDRKEKREAYQALPSLMEYLLVSQDAPHITQYIRQPDGQWQRQDYGGMLAVIALPSIECTLVMIEVYDGVDFN